MQFDRHVGSRVLLICTLPEMRKACTSVLEADRYVVLRVLNVGHAISSLRLSRFDLVVVVGRNRRESLYDDYRVLIDPNGLLKREATDHELYLPGIGIDVRAVLMVFSSDAHRIGAVVRSVMTRLTTDPATFSKAP